MSKGKRLQETCKSHDIYKMTSGMTRAKREYLFIVSSNIRTGRLPKKLTYMQFKANKRSFFMYQVGELWVSLSQKAANIKTLHGNQTNSWKRNLLRMFKSFFQLRQTLSCTLLESGRVFRTRINIFSICYYSLCQPSPLTLCQR